jgi:uncharacterized protein YjcR
MDNLRVADIADLFGIKPATVRAYHTRDQMPAADGYDKHGPWWKAATIEAWSRPGRGRRKA